MEIFAAPAEGSWSREGGHQEIPQVSHIIMIISLRMNKHRHQAKIINDQILWTYIFPKFGNPWIQY